MSQYSGDSFGSESNLNEVRSGSGNEIDDLTNSIPGVPGDDYPILAEVPELSFTCDGRVAGGKEQQGAMEKDTVVGHRKGQGLLGIPLY